MDCTKAHQYLFLADELHSSEQELFTHHLQGCASCSKEWNVWQQIHVQLKQIRESQQEAPLSLDFVETLRLQIQSEVIFYRKHPHLAWFRQQPFLHLAAAILFLASTIHMIPPLLNGSFQNTPSFTSHLIDWTPPVLRKKTRISPSTQVFVPYQNDSSHIHQEIQRRKNQYFMQEMSTPSWTQQVPYFSTPVIYPDQTSTDF